VAIDGISARAQGTAARSKRRKRHAAGRVGGMRQERCSTVLKTPMEHGVAMGYDRLAELLASLQAHGME
jgi:hypothetical protein